MTIVAVNTLANEIKPRIPQYMLTSYLKYSLPVKLSFIASGYIARTSKGIGKRANNFDNIKPVSGFGAPLKAEKKQPITTRIVGLLKGISFLKALFSASLSTTSSIFFYSSSSLASIAFFISSSSGLK